MRNEIAGIGLAAIAATIPTVASAVVIGQIDTFQNGTTDNWTAGGVLGMFPPTPPHVTTTGGGPAGAGDQYLVVTSIGGNGAGSALATFNTMQWAGNYLAAGIGGISMDLFNLGGTALTIRLRIEDPMGGPPVDEAISTYGAVLPAGGGWTPVFFPTGVADWNALSGTVAAALSQATALWIINSPDDMTDYSPIVGELGIDNITALPVPEPASILLLAPGLLGLAAAGSRRAARSPAG
jgi:hypothetical protein